MGHVQDRWTRPGAAGKRVRTQRWGRGQRWRAVWVDPDGARRVQAASSRDEASAVLARVSVEMATGAYVSPAAAGETFASYAERWRAAQLHHRPATVAQAESRLRLHVYPAIGHLPLGQVRRSDVQALVQAAAARGLAPATIAVTYGYVATIFREAVVDRTVAASPCVRISLPEVHRTRVRTLSVEQVRAIREAMPARWRRLVDVFAATGLRSGELRGLTVDRISPPVHVLGPDLPTTVVLQVDRQLAGREPGGAPRFGPPKTSAGARTVRVGASTVMALREQLREHGVGPGGLVFHTRQSGPLSRAHASEVWRAATAGMGLWPRSGWHDLRHFHVSLLVSQGMSVQAVADRLGHKDARETLETYSHLWESDEERAVAAIEAVYGGR